MADGCWPWGVTAFLACSPSAVRLFLVDCSSGRPSKRRTLEKKAKERRRFDGATTEEMRTVRWALACLPMRSPSSSFFDSAKVRKRFHTTKLFGQKTQRKLKIISDKPDEITLFTISITPMLATGKTPQKVCSLQFAVSFSRGKKHLNKNFIIYIYNIYIIIYIMSESEKK